MTTPTMIDPNRVFIFDTTLRDGEQSPGCTMTSAEKLEVARQLARLGVDIIEAGFPAASPDDLAAVQRIAREIGTADGRNWHRRWPDHLRSFPRSRKGYPDLLGRRKGCCQTAHPHLPRYVRYSHEVHQQHHTGRRPQNRPGCRQTSEQSLPRCGVQPDGCRACRHPLRD